MKTPETVVDLVNRARDRHIPHGRAGIRPFAKKSEYRGKLQWIIGYEWHRLYSHHFNGLVYTTVIGWGPTLEAAILKAEAKLFGG